MRCAIKLLGIGNLFATQMFLDSNLLLVKIVVPSDGKILQGLAEFAKSGRSVDVAVRWPDPSRPGTRELLAPVLYRGCSIPKLELLCAVGECAEASVCIRRPEGKDGKGPRGPWEDPDGTYGSEEMQEEPSRMLSSYDLKVLGVSRDGMACPCNLLRRFEATYVKGGGSTKLEFVLLPDDGTPKEGDGFLVEFSLGGFEDKTPALVKVVNLDCGTEKKDAGQQK